MVRAVSSPLQHFLRSLLLSATIALALSCLNPHFASAKSMEVLDSIVMERGGDLDDFLSDQDRINRYFQALCELYGLDQRYRPAFDVILAQLRIMIARYPALKERLMETNGLGKTISFTVLGRLGDLRLDAPGWTRYLERWRQELMLEAAPYFTLWVPGAQKILLKDTLRDLDERAKRATREWEGLYRKDKGSRASAFFNEFKNDPKLRAALAFITYTGLSQPELREAFQSRSAAVIAYTLDRLRKNPKLLYPDLEIPTSLQSILAGSLRTPMDLAKEGIIRTWDGSPIPFSSFSKAELWEFRPILRRIHGTLKGMFINECISGDPAFIEEITPERTLSIALKESQLLLPYRNKKYAGGFLHTIPIEIDNRVYTSVDLLSDVMNQVVLVEDPGSRTVKPVTLVHRWYTEAMKNVSVTFQGSNGFVIGDTDRVNNFGLADALRATSFFLEGTWLDPTRARTIDSEMERAIVGVIPKPPFAQSYSAGRIISETSVAGVRQLVLLGPPQSEMPLLDDVKWVRDVLQSGNDFKKARLWSAFESKDPSPEVAIELRRAYQNIHDGIAHPRSWYSEKARSFLAVANIPAIVALHRIGFGIRKSPQEFLSYIQDWNRAFGQDTDPALDSLRQGTMKFMDDIGDMYFFGHKPDSRTLWAVRELQHSLDFDLKLMVAIAQNPLDSAQEYIRITERIAPNTRPAARDTLNEFIQKTFDRFLSLKPSVQDHLDLFLKSGPQFGVAPAPSLIEKLPQALSPQDLLKFSEMALAQAPAQFAEPMRDLVHPWISQTLAAPEMQKWVPAHLGEITPESIQVWLTEGPRSGLHSRVRRIYGARRIPFEHLAYGLKNYLNQPQGQPRLSPALEKNTIKSFLEVMLETFPEAGRLSEHGRQVAQTLFQSSVLKRDQKCLELLAKLSHSLDDPKFWASFAEEVISKSPPAEYPELWRTIHEEFSARAILDLADGLKPDAFRGDASLSASAIGLVDRLAESARNSSSILPRSRFAFAAHQLLVGLLEQPEWASAGHAHRWMDQLIQTPLTGLEEQEADRAIRALFKSPLWQRHPYIRDWEVALLSIRRFRAVWHREPLNLGIPKDARLQPSGPNTSSSANPFVQACEAWWGALGAFNPFLKR